MTNRNIIVEKGRYTPPSARDVELVERKGIGHPDSLIDGIVEEISRSLSRQYVEDFGKVLHHNVDKGQICGGGVEVSFGKGRFTKPIYVLLSGRATMSAEGKKIPATNIAIEATERYIAQTLPNLDVKSNVEVTSRIAPGSADLVEMFLRGPRIPFSNDTSFGVGFAPFDDLENLVLKTEDHLNSRPYKSKHPEVGEDIKVMGYREKEKIMLTIAIAFIAKHISSIEQYVECKKRVVDDVKKLAKGITDMEVGVAVNTADDIKNKSVYITVCGTSAEMGDDGSVGRGNRPSGLITPFRYMSMEAAAGKNPVSHIGKLYQVLGQEMAQKIAHDVSGVEDVTVSLLSDIGSPIDRPKIASVSVITPDGEFARISKEASAIMDSGLENITELTNRIVEGKVRIF